MEYLLAAFGMVFVVILGYIFYLQKQISFYKSAGLRKMSKYDILK